MPINIAIDGPAGAGKSTIAKKVSAQLGFIYLDTGAMYRAVALKALKNGIDTNSREELAKMMDSLDITVSHENNLQKVFLDGEDVSEEIRQAEVSARASSVAVHPEVRVKMVELQRKIALEKDIVMDGRDIGSHVLPKADLKIFLTANADERARRRYEELLLKGHEVTFQEVRENMISRDKVDCSRSISPLIKVPDAIEVDTTSLTIDEVVEKILYFYKNYAKVKY